MQDATNPSLLARLRQALNWFLRERHVAVIESRRQAGLKLEPIEKIVSHTGRDRGAPAE